MTPSTSPPRRPGTGRASRDRGVRDRPGGLLAAVRGPQERIEGYQRRVEERVARARRRGRLRRARRHRRRRRRDAGDRFAAAQVDLVLCHAVTYATSSQVLPARPGRRRAGRPARACSRRARSTTTHTDTGEWLANCAACCVPEIAGAFTRARHPVRHRRRHDRRRRARVGEDRRLGARRRRRARAAALADRLPRPHLSGDARHVHGLHGGARPARRARRGARDRRPRRPRGGRHRRRGRRQAGRDPRDVRLRRSLRGPDRRARSPTSSSTGRRAWRSAWTGWSPTSSSTR